MAALIVQMDAIEGSLVEADSRLRFFHATYNRTTHQVWDEIEQGTFSDNAWAERWDVAFAELYLAALDRWQAGESTPRPWLVAFDASRSRLAPLRHVLLGMNAHINYDLPQALLEVISDADFDDPALLARRSADNQHIDTILAARVAAEDEHLAEEELPGDRTWIDAVLSPLNRFGTKRFLRESRRKVWHNTRALAQARRAGPDAYAARLADLEELAAAKVSTLLEPGHVLLRLARSGFGVELKE